MESVADTNLLSRFKEVKQDDNFQMFLVFMEPTPGIFCHYNLGILFWHPIKGIKKISPLIRLTAAQILVYFSVSVPCAML